MCSSTRRTSSTKKMCLARFTPSLISSMVRSCEVKRYCRPNMGTTEQKAQL